MLDKTEGLDERTRQKAEFYLRQVSSALSPSNFPMTNPEVLRETFATNAENLVKGMAHFAEDMSQSGDLLRISQTDASAFEVGRNLATTPGKVVYPERPPAAHPVRAHDGEGARAAAADRAAVDQQVLHPRSRAGEEPHQVPRRPGLHRVHDLLGQPGRAPLAQVLRGLHAGGHPHRGRRGAARDRRRARSTSSATASAARCSATTLAYLAARGEEPFASASFLATQVDFTHAGDLLLFTDADQLEALNELMAERGYLDGSRMANVFNMLRPRDLIWPYIVNNYLLGKKPFPFDLLYWNQDSTRMAAANHNFYLSEFYGGNRLAKREMTLAGTRLDIGKVKLPVYELATKEDHIAPAKSVFTGSQLFGGPVEFVLSGSGHIAGVVNPPGKVKYQYWTNPKPEKSLDAWLATAEEHPGSWWPNWAEWLAKYSGDWIEAREPGSALGAIEDAPGSYVKAKH